MNNDELKQYLIDNFKEIIPTDGYKFKPEFYIEKVLSLIIENNFTNLKKMIEEDSKMPFYQSQFPPPPKEKNESLTINELNSYYKKLDYASNTFNKNPFSADIEELLITIDEQLVTLELMLS